VLDILKQSILASFALAIAITINPIIARADNAAAASKAGTAANAKPAAENANKSKVAYFTLSNGMQVVVIPDHRTPVVTHMVWYRVGSADEPRGKSGIAHFLEHLMFKGTAKNPAGRFSYILASIGAQENAFTSNDYTAYYQRVAREQLKMLMEFEADRMTGLILSDAEVKPELNVVLEEQNQRVANNPAARLGEQIEAALFLNHPYGKPVIGWRHEIEALNRHDALTFYRHFYAPNNAVLVVAGDVTPAEVKTLAEETYGKIAPNADLKPRVRPKEPTHTAPRRVTLADPRVAEPSVSRYYLVPSRATGKRGESEVLDVLAYILGGGSDSRLYQTMVVDKRIAVNAGAWYQGSALDYSRLGVYGTPRPGTTLPQLESEIDAVIAAVADKGVSSEELDRAKNRLIADAVYAQDNQSSLARWYGVALMTGLTIADVEAWSDRVRSVTADSVKAAARQWLDQRRSVTGYLVKDTSKPAARKPARAGEKRI